MPRTRSLPLLVLTMALTLAMAATAFAYYTPAGGKWKYRDLFEATDGGALRLSKSGRKVTKLKLVVGERNREDCGGKRIALRGKMKIKRYKKVNGRYAVGRISKGLFVARRAKFTLDGKKVKGKLLMLWDERGTLVDSGQVTLGRDCSIRFFANKK